MFVGFMRLNAALTAIYRFVGLNLMWCAITVAGLGVLGVGPATHALARYLDGWFRYGNTPPVAATFWRTARSDLRRSIGLGLVLVVAGVITTTNVLGSDSFAVRVSSFVALLAVMSTAGWSFALLAADHQGSVPQLLRAGFFVGLGALPRTALALAAGFAVGFALIHISTALVLCFGAAVPAAAFAAMSRSVFPTLAHNSQPIPAHS